MNLLRPSIIWLLFNKTRQMNSIDVEFVLSTSLTQIEMEECPNSNKMLWKIQKSTYRLLSGRVN